MKKYHFLIIFEILIIFFNKIPVFAQVVDENQEYVEEAEKKTDESKPQNKIFYGGNFGFSIGSITDIEISPIVGYNLTKKLQVALGPDYEYFRIRDYNDVYSFNIIGIRAFTRYFIYKNLYSHIEDELLSVDSKYFQYLGQTNAKREWLNSFLVGGGFRQMIGERRSFNLTILWDFSNSQYSLTSNPVIKFDFTF